MMTLPEELDVIHLPLDAGQKTPRHVLRPGVTAASCRWCNRFVLRWSLMGEHDRALYSAGIRAQMEVAEARAKRRETQIHNMIKLWRTS